MMSSTLSHDLEERVLEQHAQRGRRAALEVLSGDSTHAALLHDRAVRRDIAAHIMLRSFHHQLRVAGIFVPWGDLHSNLDR